MGKIKYIGTLISDAPLLNRIWDECVEHNNEPDDLRWEEALMGTLAKAGYTALR